MYNTANPTGSIEQKQKSIKITSFNVRGMGNINKRQRVLQFLKLNHPGILYL